MAREQGMTPIDRGSGVAVWRQIERALADEIRAGLIPEGGQLPTEAALSDRFAVNRHTIRRAIGALSDQGLVRVEQGRGSFVRENVLDYMVGKRTRFTENVRRANRSPGGTKLSLTRETCDAQIAEELGIAAGAQVVVLTTVGEVDGRPISLGRHIFPAGLFPEFETVYGESPSITKVMEHHGFGDYQRAVTRVTARMPDAFEAEVLKAPRTRPLLYSEAVNVSPDGRPIQVSYVRYAADRFQMVFETGELS